MRAIAAAAKRLVELRDNWRNPVGASDADLKQRTLTNLYNQRPAWLANAHAALDRAVLDAYGWPHDLADDDLLARLLSLNAERSQAEPGTGKGASGSPERPTAHPRGGPGPATRDLQGRSLEG